MNGIRRVGTLAMVAAFALMGNVAAVAQEGPAVLMPPSIRVSSEAKVTARPDRAQVDMGVSTQATESRAAAEQNAQRVDAVIKALRKVLPQGSEIETVNYSLQPNYRYPREGGQPTITGYTATNMVRVTLDDLAKVSEIIDTGMRAGASHIGGIQFMLKDEEAVRTAALQEAAKKARSQAEALASTLNLRITRVLSVSDTSQPVRPLMMNYAAARAQMAEDAVSTPIEVGTMEIRATVTLIVEVVER